MRISDWSSDVCSSDLGLVLARGLASGAGARDRADRDLAVAHAHENFGARAGEREAGQIEMVEKGGGVHAAQRAVQLERRQRERRGEALREHDLKDVAGDDIILRGGHHLGIRSEEHTSELQSLMRISYADFCLKKKR